MTVFNPQYPPTTNSLNRLRLVAGCDHLWPDSVRGKSGYELLSSLALNSLIEQHASPDSYPAEMDARMAWFYQQVAAGAPFTAGVAETIGARLGYLLLTLLLNDDATYQANPDKEAAYWSYWSQVHTIHLGGGMMSGTMGAQVAEQAQAIVRHQAALSDYAVFPAAHPRILPLLGAARLVQAGLAALVLDFGGTFVKRAIAHLTTQGLIHFQILDSLPSNFPAVTVETPEDARPIFERMVDIIVQSCVGVDADTIPVSIAAYVDGRGQPLLTQHGIYMNLAQLASDVPQALSAAVSERVGRKVKVRLLHDGTAAALFYAPQEHAAVLMLGTALGSGYPVARPNLRLQPVAQPLVVDES